MSKTERKRKKSRHGGGNDSRKDSLSSLQNEGADGRPADLVRRLEDQVRREFITRQHQVELNAKLQDEYDQLRKKLAEAETYIDQLRLGASVKFDKKFVFTYERDPMDTSARHTQSEGTHTSSRRRRLSSEADNDTSTVSSSARAIRAGEESKLMAHLFEVRDLEEQLSALKQQLEAANSDDDRLKELYSIVKALETHQQELNKAMNAVNSKDSPLDHKQAQDQSLVADELSRVTSELQQLQQMIARYTSHSPSQEGESVDGGKEQSPSSEDSVQLTSAATVGNHEMMVDTLHSSIPEEYLVQTGTPMSNNSNDLDNSKYYTSVTSTLSSLSLGNQSTVQQRSVSSCDSPTPQMSTAANVDGGHDATSTEDCAGGSELSETSSMSTPLPCSEQTPLVEQRALVSFTSDGNNDDNDAISKIHPPLNDPSTFNKSQQPSHIPEVGKNLKQETSSDAAVANDDSTAIPSYRSSRKPVNFDDLTLNSAHHQQPMLSRIPVLNSPPSSYYRPPSPYNSTGAARKAGVGGHNPLPHAASNFSHFVANELDTPLPGKAGRETLPQDDKNLDSNSTNGDKKQDCHPLITDNDEGMKALQDELKSLRQLLEKQQQQQQQQQKPVGFDPSSFQFPFWQPGQFSFSGPVHSGTAHGNPAPPGQEGSTTPTHKSSITPNHIEHAPSIHGGSGEHSEIESVTEVTDSSSICSTSTTGSHNHHSTSAAVSEPSSAKPHPPTSKVAMNTNAQQQDTQPSSTNNVSDKVASKHRPKRKTNKKPSHKNNRERKKISSPSSMLQHSGQSESTISSLSSSVSSTLSMLDSERLSPAQLGGLQGDDLVDTEMMKVPSTANLSTWVCPLCGGRSVIINSSGTRQHRHREPEKVKKQSKSTQCDRASYRHVGQSTTHAQHEKAVSTEKDDFIKPRYIPNIKNSGLHYSSDVSSDRSGGLHKNRDMVNNYRSNDLHHDGSNKSSGLHRNGDAFRNRSSGFHRNGDAFSNRSSGSHRNGDAFSNRSSGFHRNGDAFSNRSSGSHRNGDAFNNRSSSLHHGYTPPVQDSGLHYSSDTPGLRSSGLQYRNKTPGIRSSVLNYNSDIPAVRSTGTQYNSGSRSYRKPRSLQTWKGDSVTFAHPKATSTPLIVHDHDYYSSDSSDVCSSPTLVCQPTDYVVVESRPRRRRYHHVRPRVAKHCHGDRPRYITTSSNEGDEVYCPRTIRSHSHCYSPVLTEAATHVSLDEACQLARRLKRRSEEMHSNLSLELSAH